MRVAVVGAGVFGLSAAVALRRRGHEVTVFDRYGVPSPHGASVDSSRLVRADYGADGFYTDLALAAIEQWHVWNRDAQAAGFPQLYHPDGVVFFCKGSIDDGGYERDCIEQMRARGRPVRRLGPGQPSPLLAVPAWASGDLTAYRDGYLQPNAGWANARAAVEYLAHVARQLGVAFRTGEAGTFVRYLPGADGASVAGLATADGAEHRADVVLVAAGPWSPSLVPELAGKIQVLGQPLVYVKVPEAVRPLFESGHFPSYAADISHDGLYGFPPTEASQHRLKVGLHGRPHLYEGRTPDGRVCSMPAPPEARARPAEAAVATIKAHIDRAFPMLRDQPVDEARLCFYCDSWDSYFYIDRVPGRPGLAVATGGSGHGFKFAPVLGDIIADAVEGRPNRWGAPFKWREPPSETARRIEACRMDTGGQPPERIIPAPSSKL